jgi:hypothetical protein
MANPNANPTKARMAKKSNRKPGDLQALQRKLWGAILHAEEVLEDASQDKDRELTLKAIHALSQCCGQYAKLLEVGEIEARLGALEERLQGKVAA